MINTNVALNNNAKKTGTSYRGKNHLKSFLMTFRIGVLLSTKEDILTRIVTYVFIHIILRRDLGPTKQSFPYRFLHPKFKVV